MRSVATEAVPSLAVSRPEAMRSRVDLPQPEGPTTLTNSPRSTVRSTPERAVVPLGNVMATLRKSRIGAVGSATDAGAGEARVTGALTFRGVGLRRRRGCGG